jgi:hypothetical protein
MLLKPHISSRNALESSSFRPNTGAHSAGFSRMPRPSLFFEFSRALSADAQRASFSPL